MAAHTADNGNAKGTTVAISEAAYIVAVGGAAGDCKVKTRKYTGRKGLVTSRYLRPKIGSCHDRCKTGVRDEPPQLKKPGRRLGVRKISVKKIKIKRSVEPVERKKTMKTKPKIPHPKIGARDEPTNHISTQIELKLPKTHVKPKPSSSSILNGQKNKKEIKNTGIARKSISVEQVAYKATSTGSLPRKHKSKSPRKDEGSMTKAKLKQLLAEKIAEMTLQEAENEEVEFVPPAGETIETPLKDEHSVTKTKLNHLIDEKITETTLHEAENAELESVPPAVEIVESPIKDEEGMTKAELKQFIAEKITEKTLKEAENAELESVPPTVEVIESPTVTTESTDLPSSESSQSSSDKQVSEEREYSKSSSDKQVSEEERKNSKSSSNKQVSEEHENSKSSLDKQVTGHENANNEEVIVNEDDDKMVNREDKENEGSKVKFMRGRVVKDAGDDDPWRLRIGKGKIPEDEDDGPRRLNFRRGKILEGNEDDGPTRLKFRRGKILDNDEDDGPTRLNFRKGKNMEDNEDDESMAKINFKKTIIEEPTDDCKKESENVTLKHQEMQEKKEAQELLNRVIEETASKLEVDRKTKVEALVGAFETVISLHDDTPSSQS